MKLSKEEEKICKEYSQRDKKGKVHCFECPLVIDKTAHLCKRNTRKKRF